VTGKIIVMKKYITLLVTFFVLIPSLSQAESFADTIKFIIEEFSDFAGNNEPFYVVQGYDEKNCTVETKKGDDSVVFYLKNTSFEHIGFGASQYNLYVFLPPTEVVKINDTYYTAKYNLSGRGPKFIDFNKLKNAWESLYRDYCKMDQL
jgi:hypothetical protein